ncbi:MAG: SEL1-like repeat protein, partial [Alphaproteobacteria bacterium]|nr:SEL1-like repeat protein [Alphaproteobacteria bacterium]
MGDTVAVRSPDDQLALASGALVGRYVVTSVLGQGSFGITYLARDGQLGRDVAIKEYLPTVFAVRRGDGTVVPNSTKSAAEFAWGRQRFIEEGRTLAGFRRMPGMVHVYDLVEDHGTAYIVMELVNGSTLEKKLDHDGQLSPQEVNRLLPVLLDVLSAVHQAGFVHRDIKPENILLDREGNPTLIDFGAARAAMAARTTAMTAVYTPGYAAIEQFADGEQGPWTDIYGLSATLYRAISGRLPPRSVGRALEDSYRPLAELKPAGFPIPLLRGIDRGLAVRAADRPQTIEQWRSALFSTEPPADAGAGAPAVGRRRRTMVYASVGALAVLAAAGAALLLQQTDLSASLQEAAGGGSSPALADRGPGGAEQARPTQTEAAPSTEAEVVAKPEVAAPRAEAEDLAEADSAFKRGDYATVRRLMKPLADAGNAKAQNYLGVLYDDGMGVPRDDAQAVAWYRKAADQGNAAAQYNLGRLYDNGHGVPQDDAQAVAWYRKAADQGDVRAQTSLGAAYDSGRGVARDLAQAAKWYRRAADQDHPAAELILGSMHAAGRGMPQDYGQAVEWFRRAAAHGSAPAEFNLGYLYSVGRGVPQDYDEAVAWYRKAADHDSPSAQTNLGAAYEAGRGVPQDFAQAAGWYRKAADQGNAVAQYNLGKLYDSGRGVPQDYRQALAWYRKAAAQDYGPAGASVGYAYDVGRGVSQDPAQAANWYRKAVDDGSVDALYALGLLYQQGRGVPRD